MEQPKQDADSVAPPKKQFITDDQLIEIWDARGLKYRCDELHRMLLERGLVPYFDRPMFRKVVMDILKGFLVDGESRRDPRHELKTRWPKVH